MSDNRRDEEAIWRGLEARLERVEDKIQEIDETVRGSRRIKEPGLVADRERMDAELRKINAVVFTDSTGKHGLAHDVDVLMGRQVGADRRSEFRWKYWVPTFLALLALLVTILTNLDKILKNFPLSPLEVKIEQAKRPRGKKIIRIRHVKAPSASGPNFILPALTPSPTDQK